CVDLFHASSRDYYFSSSPSARSSFADHSASVAFPCHRFHVQHTDRTLASRLRRHPPLSCHASFPHSSGLARVHLVRDGFRILGQPFRRSPAPYLQRQALLVSRDGILRDSIRALRESQSLRRLRRINSPAVSCSPCLC